MAKYYDMIDVRGVSVLDLSLPDMVDAVEFDQFTNEVLALIDGAPKKKWVIDLGRCTYVNSAMLGLMVNLRQRIRGAGGKIALCRASPWLLEVFQVTSLHHMFVVTKTREDALREVGA